MPSLFYPYKGAHDALAHLGPYADATVGHGCGISYSDGRLVSVLRRPTGSQHAWLNVWRRNVSAPHPIPAKHQDTGFWHGVGEFFEHAIEAYGEQQMRQAEMEAAGSRAMADAIDRHVWQPAHAWLLKHKVFADALAVTADVVGVIAGVVVICVAGPEIAVGAAIVGGLAITGSAVLAVIDGNVLAAEMNGDEAKVKRIEGSETVQWIRIIATAATLPDMAVGGVQAIRDVGKLPEEISEAKTVVRTLTDASDAQRARAAKIANPAKHVHKVQQRLSRANRLAKEAAAHAKLAATRARQLGAAKGGIVGSYVATPTGATLFAGLPPEIMLTEAQSKRDAQLLKSITPEGGMPRDARLDMRVTSLTPTHRR